MSEEQSLPHTEIIFQAKTSGVKRLVVSPSSSNNDSLMNSPPRVAYLNAESGGEFDHLGETRNEDALVSALLPVTFEGEEASKFSNNHSSEATQQNSTLFPQIGGAHSQASVSPPATSYARHAAAPSVSRRPSFGLSFFSSLSNTIRGSSHSRASSPPREPHQTTSPHSHQFMSNSPTLANLNIHAVSESNVENTLIGIVPSTTRSHAASAPLIDDTHTSRENPTVEVSDITCVAETEQITYSRCKQVDNSNGIEKDGTYSLRLTPIIDHSSSHNGLYFAPIIRRVNSTTPISVGRYTEKHKNAAHAPQGSSSRVVFKSKVVSRTHAMFQCNEQGSWFLKDCKSSSGTFLNNIRLSQASQESTLWPLMDGDVVQLGLDYRGGTEEVYRCVKMRCEFNRSWQRKVNRFNLDIHKRMKNLGVEAGTETDHEFSECAICLLKLEPCQALFISPCSHSWHYKCIRPIIIKRYPQFYCPNCRSVCDLETDIEDEEEA